MIPSGHRRLILTRHAKSSWDDPAVSDHDRPLNRRGMAAALELGEWLASRGYEPDEVLCSDARRTRETWARAAAAPLEVMPRIAYLPALYQAPAETMLDILRRATGDCVMMLGHNPGIAALAATLAARLPNHPDLHRYPTAATLVIDFDAADWRQIGPGTGGVRDYFIPSRRG